MLRGIIVGLVSGGALGLLLAGILSLVSPLPSQVDPQTTTQAPAAKAEVSAPLATSSETDTPVAAEATAQSPESVEQDDNAPQADVSSAPRPVADDTAPVAASPAEGRDTELAVNSEAPVLPNPQTAPLDVPAGAPEDSSISAEPAQPVSPIASESSAFSVPVVTPAPTVAETDAPKQITSEATAPTAPTVAPAPIAPPPAEPATKEEVTSLLKAPSDLNERFPQLKSNRLPSIGTESAAVVEEVAPLRPIEAFAETFDNPDEKPVMAIVLMDVGAAGIDMKALERFPIPLSIAVTGMDRRAAARAQTFRAAGLEVLSLIDLPEGASPEDVEVNLASQLAAVPEAVALLEGAAGGLQENRTVSDQVIEIVLKEGYGLVMLPKGLNTAQKMAAREGVPSLTIFRDFDGAGQSEVVIRRFLDQAAFKARQVDGVIMLGRLTPETLSALAVWSLADRAKSVAMGPVSAALQARP